MPYRTSNERVDVTVICDDPGCVRRGHEIELEDVMADIGDPEGDDLSRKLLEEGWSVNDRGNEFYCDWCTRRHNGEPPSQAELEFMGQLKLPAEAKAE